jgi:hypothetical protein
MRVVLERGTAGALTLGRKLRGTAGASTPGRELRSTAGASTPPLPLRERVGVRGLAARTGVYRPPTPTLPLKGGGGKK